MDGLWTVCDMCGALVALEEKHQEWHAAQRQEAVDDDERP